MRKILVAAALAASLLASCSNGSGGESSGTKAQAAPEGASVTLEAIAFDPSELEIEVGTTVTWTNQDEGVAHTVTSGTPKEQGVPGISENVEGKPDGTFDKELADAGDTYEFTFEEPGTYQYFCAIHAPMTGTVIVTN